MLEGVDRPRGRVHDNQPLVEGISGKRHLVRAGLEGLHVRIFFDLQGLEIDHRQRILRHLVGFLLFDLGLAGLLEFRFDQAVGPLAVSQQAGTAGNPDFLAVEDPTEDQFGIAFLRSNLIREDAAVRRQLRRNYALPAVIDIVVHRLFLGQGRSSGRQQDKQQGEKFLFHMGYRINSHAIGLTANLFKDRQSPAEFIGTKGKFQKSFRNICRLRKNT